MSTVIVRIAWKWGGGRVVSCSGADAVAEVARENGSCEPGVIAPVFVWRGRVLAAEFTLRWNKVETGDRIIAFIPEPRTRGPGAE
jgi:hypothetical protein